MQSGPHYLLIIQTRRNFYLELIKNLKKLRLERGLTQKQLADALGIDRTAVAKYETGKNGATSEMLEKIADYFAVSSDYVLGRDQEISYALLDGGEHFRIDDATHREIMEFAGYAKEQKKAPSEDGAFGYVWNRSGV